jgi:hypothetical protein
MYVALKVFKLIGPSNDGRRHGRGTYLLGCTIVCLIKLGLIIMICGYIFFLIQLIFHSRCAKFCIDCFQKPCVFCQTSYQAQRKNIFCPLKAKWIGRSDRIGNPENACGSECGIRSNFRKGSVSGIRS